MGLTVTLQQSCVRLLMQCWEFKEKSTLEVLFGIEPLPKYVNALPMEVRSQMQCTELVVHNLFSFPAGKGQPLLDLLIVLRDKRSQEDGERKELDDLFKQVSFYLGSLAGDAETTAGDEHKGSETREFRAAIRNYQLSDQESKATTQAPTDAASWIGEVYEQPGEWAFRVALAVFSGASWDACMEAALDLASRLPQPPAIATETSSPLSPPLLPRSPLKLLEEAGGHLVTTGSLRIVRLKESQLPRGVLDYVWDEYTRRELLMQWLSNLVTDSKLNNRIRASVATGLLMLTNFDSIQRNLFSNWARAEKDRRAYRAAIGQALGVVAEEGTRLDGVRKLLKSWAASPHQALRWAAARAYIYVGGRCPVDEMIAQWRIIAEAEDVHTQTVSVGIFSWVFVNPLHASLLDAMERFFLGAAEMPEIRQTAFVEGLFAFKRWADDAEREAKVERGFEEDESGPPTLMGFGLLMFIKLARILLPGGTDSLSWPPILLTLVDGESEQSLYRQSLTEMFERMLCDPAAHPTALDLLRDWLERVEHNGHYQEQFQSLLDELLTRPGIQGEIRRILAMHLNLWSPRSRFQLKEPHPGLSEIQQVILVVDNSESALPFWTEVKGIALELGSALSERPAPQVYRLNSRQPETLLALDESNPNLTGPMSAGSFIAPVMQDLAARGQRIDALILIGNGEVFDLADWLGHPLIDRWVLVRVGPNSMIGSGVETIDEVEREALSTVFERLRDPPPTRVAYYRPATPTGVANGEWRIDRSGYPLIHIEPLRCYLHLFPIAKAQFERFLAGENAGDWGDREYVEMLKSNPRASYRAPSQPKYEQLFLTGVRPKEANAFGAWLGDAYSLPDERQWLAAYDWLANQPVPAPPPDLAEDALAIWQIIVAQQSPTRLLDLSLMCEGVREWVTLVDSVEKHGGMGCPTSRFPTLSRNPRKLVSVTTTETRQDAYGFRLLAR